jgi:hypothetical protein
MIGTPRRAGRGQCGGGDGLDGGVAEDDFLDARWPGRPQPASTSVQDLRSFGSSEKLQTTSSAQLRVDGAASDAFLVGRRAVDLLGERLASGVEVLAHVAQVRRVSDRVL